jgi:pyruvate/2-oxoglutarate dehydrogenase complex dihydrolipoamide dehydrogenase (E3) component
MTTDPDSNPPEAPQPARHDAPALPEKVAAESAPEARYDVVVVGGGAAGTCAALAAAEAGASVCLVRRSDRALSRRASARAAVWALSQIAFSCSVDKNRIQPTQSLHPGTADAFSELAPQLARIRRQLGQRFARARLQAAGVEVLAGTARFVSPEVFEADGRRLRFGRAILATGASPGVSTIDGADRLECLTSENLGQLARVPGSLAVIGTDGTACQLAQAFGRLGSQVHVIGCGSLLLPDLETEAGQMIQTQLLEEGVRIHLDCSEVSVDKTGDRPTLTLVHGEQRQKLFVDAVFLDGSAEPNLLDLELPVGKVQCNAEELQLDDRLRTTNPRIFAAGAVCGPAFASWQAAEASAHLAVHNALHRHKRSMRRLAVPSCIDTEPQIARVGMSAVEAEQAGAPVQTYLCTFDEIGTAATQGDDSGYVRLHVDSRRGLLLGATVVAADAGQLIAPLVLAMNRQMPLEALAGLIPCQPSRLEILRQLALRHGRASPASTPRRWWRIVRQCFVAEPAGTVGLSPSWGTSGPGDPTAWQESPATGGGSKMPENTGDNAANASRG